SAALCFHCSSNIRNLQSFPTRRSSDLSEENITRGAVIGMPRLFLEFAAGAILIVLLLRLWIPLKAIRLFQGDYLVSFLLLFGLLVAVAHWSCLRPALAISPRHLLAAGFAGVVLLLLSTAWFDLTFYEAWLTGARWVRFPFLLIALLPYYIAEETLLGPAERGTKWRRLALALTLRLITWGVLMGDILFLHCG